MIVLSWLATSLSLSLSFLSLPLTKEVSMCEPDYVVLRQLINLRYIKLRYRGREIFYLLSLSLSLFLSFSIYFSFFFFFLPIRCLTCPRSVAHFSNIDSFFLLILFSRSLRSATFLPPSVFFFYSVVIAPPSFALECFLWLIYHLSINLRLLPGYG